jgi:proteasome accessory factor C
VPRPSSEERLRRILAVVPWVAGHDGPRVDEVCARFGYRNQAELQSDLDLLFLCGVPPYTPDALIEVDVADDRVWIRYADWFDRPLRLTPAEALTLVASSSALLGAGAENESESPLARGLAKLAGALGVSGELVEVELGPAPADRLSQLQEAVDTHHQVEIEYYAYGRDRWSTRVIDPALVYSASGQWYVTGFCHAAGDERLFRVDRIRRATTLPTTFEPRGGAQPPPVFEATQATPTVELDLAPGGAWAAGQYPTVARVDGADGHVRVTLAVGGEAWLARLLLRLGRDATVVRGDAGPAARAAERILARYRRHAGPGGTPQPVPSSDMSASTPSRPRADHAGS